MISVSAAMCVADDGGGAKLSPVGVDVRRSTGFVIKHGWRFIRVERRTGLSLERCELAISFGSRVPFAVMRGATPITRITVDRLMWCGSVLATMRRFIRMPERTLSEQDLIDVLEEIIRDGSNAAARIAAIRQLREMDAGGEVDDEFAELDELAPRRHRTQAS